MFAIIVVVGLLLILSMVAGFVFKQRKRKFTENVMQNEEVLQQIISLPVQTVKNNSSVNSKDNLADSLSQCTQSSESSTEETVSQSSEECTSNSSSRSSASSHSESSSESSESSESTESSETSVATGDKHVSCSFAVDLNSQKNADENEKNEPTKGKMKIFKKGNIVNERYVIDKTLGEGTFGLVVSAIDKCGDQPKVAIKVINSQKHKRMAKEEVEVLEKLLEIDPQGTHLFVRMEEFFKVDVYSCIVFEILGLSVYEYQKSREYEPYSLDDIRHIAYQVCYAIDFLHSHLITHTDLKPENVVFVDYPEPLSTHVKLIDLGSATFEEEGFTGIVTTRHYRAPEVILQLGWSYPCDVWSIGCVLCEMYTGDVLFPKTHDNSAHIWMMERIIGPFPAEMRLKTRKTEYFKVGLENLNSAQTEKITKKCNRLHSCMRREEDSDLFDLISRMLTYEQNYRITCKKALKHQFFDKLPSHFRLI